MVAVNGADCFIPQPHSAAPDGSSNRHRGVGLLQGWRYMFVNRGEIQNPVQSTPVRCCHGDVGTGTTRPTVGDRRHGKKSSESFFFRPKILGWIYPKLALQIKHVAGVWRWVFWYFDSCVILGTFPVVFIDWYVTVQPFLIWLFSVFLRTFLPLVDSSH